MKLLCLDSNSILNRAFYGVKLLSTKNGTYTNAVFGFMNIFQKLLNDVEPDAVVCAFDLKAPTFRHKMYDGYKAQRKGMPEELAQQLPLIKELLTDLGYLIVTKEGYEADDILGTFSRMCEEQGHHCYIATGDRDSLQLIGKNTTVLLASSKMGKSETTFCDEEYFRQKYGTDPIHLIDIKALMGDSSDNIPGVAGIGEKTALKLVSQHPDLESIYENIDTLEIGKSIKNKLIDGKESAFMSKTLATIDRNVPLEVSVEECIPKQRDEQAAFSLLTALEMNSMIKKLDLHGEYIPAAEETAEETLAPVNCQKKPLTELLDSDPEAVASFLCQWDEKRPDTLLSAAVCVGENLTILHPEQDDNDYRVWLSFLSGDRKKITFDCKKVYRWCINHNSSLENLSDDLMLSAYLLSPNSTDYQIDLLCGEFHLNQSITNAECFSEEEQSLAQQCACLAPLEEHIRKEIITNGQEKLLNDIELPLAEVLASMELYGFEVDTQALSEYGMMLDQKIDDYKNMIYQLAGEEFNINSPKQLGEVLFEHLGLPARKKTKTGYSTNADVLESLRGKHEIIDHILEYRKVAS